MAATVDLNGTLTNVATSSIPSGGAITYASGTPANATVNTSSGAITPVGTGTSVITATQAASSGTNAVGTQTYTLTVNPALVATQTSPSTTLTQNQSASFTPVTGSGGTGALTYALYNSANTTPVTLSNGTLAFSSTTGLISGTPNTIAATTTYTVRVTDSATNPLTTTAQFALTVAAPIPTASPDSTTATYNATGGTASTAINLSSYVTNATKIKVASNPAFGTLDVAQNSTSTGLTLNYTSNPGYYGSDSFTYYAVAADGTTLSSTTGTVNLTITAPTLSVSLATGAAATAGTALPGGYKVNASGGLAPYTCTIGSPGLPGGLTLNPDCTITGTPSAPGAASFNVTVSDSATSAGAASNVAQTTATPLAFSIGAATAPTISAAFTAPTTGTSATSIATTQTTTLTVTFANSNSFSLSNATGSVTLPANLSGTSAGGTCPSPAYPGGAGGTLSFGPGTLPAAGCTLTLTVSSTTPNTYSVTGTGTVSSTQSGSASPGISSTNSLSVSALPAQAITFTSTAPSPGVVGGATYTVLATGGSSGNPVIFTIDGSSTAGACSISSGIVTFAGIGTCVVDANQLGNSSYSAAPQVQQTITVKAAQTITFTSTIPANATAGGATYTVTASGGGSGNAVTFTIDGLSTNGACTLSSGIVTFTGSGTCIVDANQLGNASYIVAPQVQQTIAVKGSQTITFTSTAPLAATVGGATYAVTATGGASGIAVVLTIDASASGVCTISGSTVSFIGLGTCIIDASQAGNSSYAAASPVQQSFNVGKGSQTITFTSTIPTTPVISGTYTPTATGGGSGNPVVFSIDGTSTAGACSIASGVVTFNAQGTCKIDANQASNANFNTAPQVQQSITINKKLNAITFNSLPSRTYGSAPFQISATATSGDTVTFASLTTSVCTVTGTTVTIVATGSCQIQATDPGNTTYAAAMAVTQSFTVSDRPNPAQDPEVIGVVTVETTAAEQFAQIQIGNFNQRLEQMHGEGYVADSFGISLVDGIGNDDSQKSGYADDADPMSKKAEAANSATDRALKKRNREQTAEDKARAASLDRAFSFWTAGAINIGRIHANNTVSTTDLSTGGLSVGVDYRFNQLISLGFGLGYGALSADVGTNGTTVTGRNYDAVVYASIRPTTTSFIDALAGAGLLDFSSSRYITGGYGTATGKRSGQEAFGSVTAGLELKTKDTLISPYVRFDARTGTLNAFDENAPASWAVHYDKETFSTASVNLGIKAALHTHYDDLPVSPFIRAEFQHDLVNTASAGVTYVDQVGISDTTIVMPGSNANRILLGVGTEITTLNDFKLMLEYLNTFSTSSASDASTLRFKMTKAF